MRDHYWIACSKYNQQGEGTCNSDRDADVFFILYGFTWYDDSYYLTIDINHDNEV